MPAAEKCPHCETPIDEGLAYVKPSGSYVAYCPPCDRDVPAWIAPKDDA